jgi:hypothetical protein
VGSAAAVRLPCIKTLSDGELRGIQVSAGESPPLARYTMWEYHFNRRLFWGGLIPDLMGMQNV